MKKKPKYVRIALLIKCECGHQTDAVENYGGNLRITPGYTTESGTSWPGEIEITCPGCGGLDHSRTCC